MGFKQLDLKRSYDSYFSDLTAEFFNPVLSEAKNYLRAAAYFSSSSLKAISRGLAKLLARGGVMKLIVAILTSEADYEAIIEGKKLAKDIIMDTFLDESAMFEMLNNSSVSALCKLVASKRLEIKFIISNKGIFHMKFGVLEDSEGNLLSFSGSLNETYEGYELNGEEIKVFRGWVPGEAEYVKEDWLKFNMYWESHLPNDGAIVSDLPEEAREKIEYAVRSANGSDSTGMPGLRYYQEAAINFFAEKNFHAMLEMATGTGKTLVALYCAKALYEKLGKKFTVVAVPTNTLAQQWKREWAKFFGIYPVVYSDEAKEDFFSYCIHSKENGVVIMTYSALSRRILANDLIPIIRDKVSLIADEAHWLGAKNFSRIMDYNFEYRLGLSATPERLFDEEGTSKILNFFGNNKFEYSLQKAVEDGYLAEFNYYPHYCRLMPDEIEEIGKLTRKALSANGNLDDEQISPQEIALIKRAKVVKKARCKDGLFKEIINKLSNTGSLDHVLAFFEDHDQLSKAKGTLIDLKVPFGIVDASTDNLGREANSLKLENGTISCLLSMRVMDEGVDIRSAKREILMASSSNERQYIQRAGRILRLQAGKGRAEIFDIIPFAEKGDCPDWLWKYEINAIKKEMKRAMYFCKAATNRPECIASLHAFAEKINISIWL